MVNLGMKRLLLFVFPFLLSLFFLFAYRQSVQAACLDTGETCWGTCSGDCSYNSSYTSCGCVASCTPSCGACGSNGCGGTCSDTCLDNQTCVSNQCVTNTAAPTSPPPPTYTCDSVSTQYCWAACEPGDRTVSGYTCPPYTHCCGPDTVPTSTPVPTSPPPLQPLLQYPTLV